MKHFRIWMCIGSLMLLLLLSLCRQFIYSENFGTNPDGIIAVQEPLISLDEAVLQKETVSNKEPAIQSETVSLNAAMSQKQAESETQTMVSLNPDRVTYQPDFYYEPISEEVKNRINGLSYKEDCTVPYEDLRYISILYLNFEGKTETGEIICNKAIAEDMVEIFYELYLAAYPIEKIRLVDEYGADDTLSITENNTSCFNYRVVEGSTKLSKHALGLAIDINPFYNPYVTYPNGGIRISPIGSEFYADRNNDFPYKLDKNDLCYQLFIEHGFTWGGAWKSLKDYQHFQKEIN